MKKVKIVFTDDQLKEIISLYDEGVSPKRIGCIMGCSGFPITNALKDAGKLRTPEQANAKRKELSRKRNTDKDYIKEKIKNTIKINEDTGCWEWDGNRHVYGYGTLSLSNKNYLAHRVSYQIHKGEIFYGNEIRHLCHNPPCCNPDHLEQGSSKDNSEDMVNAKRSMVGERHPMRKLNNSKILKIREMANSGKCRQWQIGEMFGIDASTVSYIKNNKRWSHI